MLFVLILLIIAAAAGVLGWVIKVTAVIVLSVILTMVILGAGTYYYLRYRFRRFARDMDRRHRSYPARGYRGSTRHDAPGAGSGPGELP